MTKIRILLVEGCAAARRLTANVLACDPALEVAGTAADGALALAKAAQVRPDLVLLDAALPEDDGGALTALRNAHPLLPVVLFAGPPARSGRSGPDLLRRKDEETEAAMRRLRADVIPRIKASFARSVGVGNALPDATAGPARPSSAEMKRVEAVAIGASTGGPQALAALLAALPAKFPVPVVIVQHVLSGFTGFLAQRLASQLSLPVHEGAPDMPVEAGRVFIAPGDLHMETASTPDGVRLRLHQGPPENSCRPSADVLFRSAAQAYGAGVLAVVLTGMGRDGAQGCARVREAGGQVLVQDEATSVVWGMPGTVARAGLAEQVLPLDQLGPEILRCVRRGRSTSSPG